MANEAKLARVANIANVTKVATLAKVAERAKVAKADERSPCTWIMPPHHMSGGGTRMTLDQDQIAAVTLDYYNQRADRSEDAELKAILIHNRDEEIEHANMLFEYLRRRMPEFDLNMKKYLFSTKPVTKIESGGTAPAHDLGLAGLKPNNP